MGFLTNKNLIDMRYVELMKKEENKKEALRIKPSWNRPIKKDK